MTSTYPTSVTIVSKKAMRVSEFPRRPNTGSPVSENSTSETVRKGVRVASEAIVLVDSSSEIELLGPVSSVFEASVRSLSGLFGQSQKRSSGKLRGR